MKYFSLFTGVGGFEIGIEKAYEDKRLERERASGDTLPRGQEALDRTGMDNKLSSESSGFSLASSVRPVCVGFSEIDKYASAVLRYRFPNVKNYGDITKIDWSTVPDFDLLVGGSPCQDFSIAGKRQGLSGLRSGLFNEYVRCLEEKKPSHFIWENVKGVMSSGGGRHFGIILNSLAEAGYSLSWQVLNAKDFGVPQNRERVFVVGTRGDGGREVFFETGSRGADTEAGADAEQGAQSIATRHLGRNGGLMADHASAVQVAEVPHILRWQNKQDGVVESDFAPSLRASGGTDIRKKPMVRIPEATKQGYAEAEVGDSINLSVPDSTTRRGRVGKGIANTVDTGMQQYTLTPEARIRRLTERECEALMSWPQDWTKTGMFEVPCSIDGFDFIPKEISGTQRYKMCGNGVVSAVVAEIVKAYFL